MVCMMDSLCIRHFGIMRWQIDHPVNLPQLLIPSDPLLLSSFTPRWQFALMSVCLLVHLHVCLIVCS